MARSVHAALTSAAKQCVGIDYDGEAVAAILGAGAADNLIAANVYDLDRSDVPLTTIDVIVAGDIVEHLANPGLMLDRLRHLADSTTVLAVTVPNAEGLPQFLRYARGHRVEGEDHKCSFNLYSLSNLLEATGWRVRCVDGCYQPRAAELNSSVTFRLGHGALRRFPHLAGTLLVVAEPT